MIRPSSLRPPRPQAAPRPRARSSPAGGSYARPALPAALLLLLATAGRAGVPGRAREFLDFGAGVLALVSLTATVLWGLAATDRLLLGSSHRLLAQGVHRGLGVAGIGFLALHVWVKVAEGHVGAAAAAVPFTDRAQPLLVGLGSVAGYLFVTVAVTGAVRSAFAAGGRSRAWRALHMSAYPAWGAALLHGLHSGRPASGWVTAGYALCVAGVAAALVVRVRGGRNGRGGNG
ncbi:hypothetical protein AB0K09_29690 [Streptomyces sp. NPDC049577]|uniref:hypothetical protein n=1 Tax=Streptomyces sp. NPDC049577 TaxID=3155153 RepID=UPI003432805F